MGRHRVKIEVSKQFNLSIFFIFMFIWVMVCFLGGTKTRKKLKNTYTSIDNN